MADLLEQVAQLPRDNSIKAELSPTTIKNRCPQCGGQKRSIAKMCLQCRREIERPPIRPEMFFVNDKPCRYLRLTKGKYAIVSAHRHDYLDKYCWSLHWSGDSNGIRYYAKAWIGHGTNHVRLHRFITGITDRKVHVDHRNGDGLDCRDENLRVCEPEENNRNRNRKNRNNTSGYRGVTWHTKHRVWYGTVFYKGKSYHAGSHPTDIVRVAWLRDMLAAKLFGEFATFNFPERATAWILEMAQSGHQAISSIQDHHDVIQ